MKARLLAALMMLVLGACTTEPPRASGSITDKTFHQDIGMRQQPLFSPDCPVQ